MVIIETNKFLGKVYSGMYVSNTHMCVPKILISNVSFIPWLRKISQYDSGVIHDTECVSIYDLHVMIW